jgi:iron complex outermembrane receptor protein
VTGNPLGSETFDLATPALSVDGRQLRLRMQNTLGETLTNEPGMSSTYFGPNSSRPTIRGLDSERVQILRNGAQSLDVATLSYDHNVPVEPITVDRVEVIRGPAAVLYGGSAIGGVVNVLDSRIATERNPRGVSGAIDTGYGSDNINRTGAVRLNVGLDNGLNLHFDGFDRANANLRIPGFQNSLLQMQRNVTAGLPPGGGFGSIPNTSASAEGGGIGGSYVADNGSYAGLSYGLYQTNYGTPAEETVRISMKQETINFAGEARELPGFQSVKVKVGFTNYRHNELDAGIVEQTFATKGFNSRVEARHNDIGPFEGVIGFQGTNYSLGVLGLQPLLPNTQNWSYGLFAFEQAKTGPVTWQAGANVARAQSDAAVGPNNPVPLSRGFTPVSVALGAVYTLTPDYALALNATHTERAPSPQELYSNGPHDVTGTFEIGNPDLKVERSNGVDLALRKRNGPWSGAVSVYYNKFQNFIFLTDTGLTDPGTGLPVFAYTGVPATFFGGEVQGKVRLVDAGYQLDLRGMSDYVHAQNDRLNEPLPRIAPLRVGAGFDYAKGPAGASVDLIRAWGQGRTEAFELPTNGYWLLNASLTYTVKTASQSRVDLYLKGVNLLDQQIRNSTSIIAQVAPYGSRGVVAGARLQF